VITPLFGALNAPLAVPHAPPPIAGPAGIGGLRLWLRADAEAFADAGGATPAADGGPVALWRDQSGAGRHATAAGSARPTYRAAALNGRPLLDAPGAPVLMALASALSLPGAFTLYAILARSAGTTAWPLTNGASGPAALGVLGGTAYAVDDINTFPSLAFTGTAGAALWRFRRAAANQAPRFAATGQADAALTAPCGTLTLSALFARPIDTQYSAGRLGELIVYDADLAAAGGGAADAAVRSYLLARWGVSFPGS
jgi:hypothetical protein